MKILHVDMDAFYASVEQRDDPTLRGRPVVVGGSPGGRGVVAAASYEARAYGIHSAMPSSTAIRRCPDLVFVRGDFSKYREVSRQMHTIFQDYTDRIEPLSLDEAYLDVTDNHAGLPYASLVAAEIRTRIREELGLTASAGVAPVKFVAKIASDHRKPDGLTVVPPGAVLEFLHPHPVRKLPGVGPATAKQLVDAGFRTVGDLFAAGPEALIAKFGNRGQWLARLASGIDGRGIRTERIRKSRGAERTFASDMMDPSAIREVVHGLADRLVEELQDAQERARSVTLKVRYHDFQTITRSTTLSSPTDRLAPVLGALDELLGRTDVGIQPVRLMGVSFSQLWRPGSAIPLQLDLPLEVQPHRPDGL